MRPDTAGAVVQYFASSSNLPISAPTLSRLMGTEMIALEYTDLAGLRQKGIRLGSFINEKMLLVDGVDDPQAKGPRTIIERVPQLKLRQIHEYDKAGAHHRTCLVTDMNHEYPQEKIEEALQKLTENTDLMLDFGAVRRKAETIRLGGRSP